MKSEEAATGSIGVPICNLQGYNCKRVCWVARREVGFDLKFKIFVFSLDWTGILKQLAS
jgi:hypothetical protein